MQFEVFVQSDDFDFLAPCKLLASGMVWLNRGMPPVLLQRGMSVLAEGGCMVGVVAAVVWNCLSQKLTCFLLGEVPPTAVYRFVPISFITEISNGVIQTRLTVTSIEKLPRHQPGF
ncbi:MAG: hypothetical protein Kow0080_33450 [Candidatus Promineifilaceae bacterium]